eukprot:COSAG06_NODE_5077_length_3742_cov_4.453788_3_plen_45_part_01
MNEETKAAIARSLGKVLQTTGCKSSVPLATIRVHCTIHVLVNEDE